MTVFRFTGPQWGGLFDVPERWCRECDLFVRAADEAAEQASVPAEVEVVGWWSHPIRALRYGGVHPPVMVVDGRRIAQGEEVPEVERVREAIEAAAERGGGGSG